MILASADGHNITMRSSFGELPPWFPQLVDSVSGNAPLSLERAVGLPALLACLFRLGEGVGMMPQLVYRGKSANRGERKRDPDSLQWRLLHDRPNSDGIGPAAFRGDLALSFAGAGEAFVRKYKARGGTRVVELVAQDARKITPRRVNGRIVYEDRTEGQVVTRTSSEIIHIRGLTLPGTLRGLSRVSAARLALSTGMKRLSYEGRYFDRNAEPRVVLEMGDGVDRDQAKQWIEIWDAEHAGLENAHGTSAVPKGTTVTVIPVSLADAQFVESNRYTVSMTAGLFGIPLPLVAGMDGENGKPITEADRMQFVTFACGPIFTAIDDSFNRDEDLFPPEEDRFAEHLADGLLRPDTKTRYDAYKAARQAGWLTANEIRALENYPPDDRGDELQATPVGGAPNRDPEN